MDELTNKKITRLIQKYSYELDEYFNKRMEIEMIFKQDEDKLYEPVFSIQDTDWTRDLLGPIFEMNRPKYPGNRGVYLPSDLMVSYTRVCKSLSEQLDRAKAEIKILEDKLKESKRDY